MFLLKEQHFIGYKTVDTNNIVTFTTEKTEQSQMQQLCFQQKHIYVPSIIYVHKENIIPHMINQNRELCFQRKHNKLRWYNYVFSKNIFHIHPQ